MMFVHAQEVKAYVWAIWGFLAVSSVHSIQVCRIDYGIIIVTRTDCFYSRQILQQAQVHSKGHFSPPKISFKVTVKVLFNS